jgi:hypothetical protein
VPISTPTRSQAKAGRRRRGKNALDRAWGKIQGLLATPNDNILPISATVAQLVLKYPKISDIASLAALLDADGGQLDADSLEIDINGDGIPDLYITADGYVDLHPDTIFIKVDVDDDGIPDFQLTADGGIDVDGDDIPDFRLTADSGIDVDGDGIPDFQLTADGGIDIDGDGIPDFQLTADGGIDIDGDGIPDF